LAFPRHCLHPNILAQSPASENCYKNVDVKNFISHTSVIVDSTGPLVVGLKFVEPAGKQFLTEKTGNCGNEYVRTSVALTQNYKCIWLDQRHPSKMKL